MNFKCTPCNLQLNSKSQWDQHVIGGKHLRAAQLHQPQQVDMSAAIALPGGAFKCKFCDDFACTGQIPFEQHVVGQKHLRNVQRSKESSPSPDSPVFPSAANNIIQSSPPLLISPSTSNDMSDALLQPDGLYKCRVCADFLCSGPVPMEQHLKGKLHQKNKTRNTLATLPIGELTISSPLQVQKSSPPLRRKIDLIPTLSVEERVEKAWNHKTICGYTYDDSFSQLTANEKIEILSPHFAFVSKEDDVPNLVKFLTM